MKGADSAAYQVTIQPEVLSLKTNDQNCCIQAGMEGNVETITRKETVLQFFLSKARLITGV